jgi:S-(hydroxymethyl)glutathione dehydrogenase/alcohol dehydrogenase
VDTRPEKLELARSLGATDTVRAAEGADVVAAVRDLTGGGPDYAFEAIGSERAIQQAWAAARAGGTVVVVGMMPRGSTLTLDPWPLISEKTLKGSFLGSARIHEDIPRLVDLYSSGELELDRLVSRKLPLSELQEAFDRLRAGDAVRQVVVFD